MLSSYLDNPHSEPNLSALGFYPAHHGLNDCTHFTTECLIAGGFPAPPTAARQFAPSLFTHLSNHAHVRTLASEVSITEAAKVIGAGPMKTGDVIMYSTPGQPRPERHHAVIFLEAESRIAKDGQIARHAPAGITMHTWHKWREPWQDAGGVYAINPGSSPVTAVGMTSNGFMLSAVKL